MIRQKLFRQKTRWDFIHFGRLARAAMLSPDSVNGPGCARARLSSGGKLGMAVGAASRAALMVRLGSPDPPLRSDVDLDRQEIIRLFLVQFGGPPQCHDA